jgi:hypothetical protein
LQTRQVEWLTLVSTLSGGILGLAGGLLADTAKSRRERKRKLDDDRRQWYVDYLLALTETDGALQLAAVNSATPLARASLTEAWRQHSLPAKTYYVTLVAPPNVADAAEDAFNRLKDIRESLGSQSIAVHNSSAWDAIHEPCIHAVTRLRQAMRSDVTGSGRRRRPSPLEEPDPGT